MPSRGRRISRENLGAWILKCNPAVTDLPGLIDQGVTSWCAQKSYRTDLFEAGQPVLLWVSGSAGGVWAAGHVTGPAELRSKYVVPVVLEFLAEPIAREVVKAHPALADLEVLRQPQMSNPSFATRTQYAVLCELQAR